MDDNVLKCQWLLYSFIYIANRHFYAVGLQKAISLKRSPDKNLLRDVERNLPQEFPHPLIYTALFIMILLIIQY